MSSSVAPIFPNTSVFIPAYWEASRTQILTQEEADARYLKFPAGQGTESIPNLIVSGSSTLGVVSASTLTASTQINLNTDNNYALNIGTGSVGAGNMTLQTGSMNRNTIDPTNVDISVACYNTSGAGNQRGEMVVSSGTSTLSAQAQLTAFSRDGLGISAMTLQETSTNYSLYKGDGSVDYYSGFLNFNYTPSTYPTAMMYALDSGSIYFGIRIPGGQNSIQFFYGGSTTSTTNIASFSSGSCVLYSNLQFNSTSAPCGIVEKSVINTTTTGTTALSSTSSYLTTINTPSVAGRTFTLPNPSGLVAGQWFGFCNKSGTNTIIIQYPAGTTIYTIPVASAGTAGSSIKLAIDSAGTAYYKVG